MVGTPEYRIAGCVTEIHTGSIDPQRYPFAYQKTEEELLAEQPQIFEFLRTSFRVSIIGYLEKESGVKHILPPRPSKIHAFVRKADKHEIALFLTDPAFLHLLFGFQEHIKNMDELILAILRELTVQDLLTTDLLDGILHIYSLRTGNEYRRLKLLLARVEHLKNQVG